MFLSRFKLATLVITSSLISLAQAAQVGYFLDVSCFSTPTQVNAAITAAGHTPTQVITLNAAALAPLNSLVLFNCSNGDYAAINAAALAAITTATNGGMNLLYFDRRVTEAATNVPGAAAIAFTRLSSEDLEPIGTNPITAGLGGTITSSNLDGLGNSTHGYFTAASLPVGAVPYLSTNVATQVVAASWTLGTGKVFYSASPMDYAIGLSGAPGTTFTNLYFKNVLYAFAGGPAPLAAPAVVPTLSQTALFGLLLLLSLVALRQLKRQ
jgi:hypothetical protein